MKWTGGGRMERNPDEMDRWRISGTRGWKMGVAYGWGVGVAHRLRDTWMEGGWDRTPVPRHSNTPMSLNLVIA